MAWPSLGFRDTSRSSAKRACSATGETAPSDTVFADFANSQHNVRMHNAGCMRMQSRRKADGDTVGIDYAGVGVQDKCSARPA